MKCKKVVGVLLAAVITLTSLPFSQAAAAEGKENGADLAAESGFEVVFDSDTGGITSMKLDNDPHKGDSELELNWVNGSKSTSGNGVDFGDTTWGMGPLYNSEAPASLEITDTKSDAVFETDQEKVHIVRELTEENRVIEETYTFTNTSDTEIDYGEGELGIYVPFNDYYEASNLATERRCNTHIWAGEDYSYIYAVRMGGNGPHVGLALTQGSMASYGQVGYSRSNSNDRGKFIFNNDAMTLSPGESYTVAWKIFAHNGEEDFYQKLDAQEDFVRLESDYYTKEQEKGEAFSITAISAADLEGATLQAKKVSYRNKGGAEEFPEEDRYSPVYGEAVEIPAEIEGEALSAEFKPESIGEYVVELTTREGKKAICKLNYVSSMDSLMKNRVTYILDHQQALDTEQADYYGGFFPYNTESGRLEVSSSSDDHSGARERLAMPITLALYYQVTEDEVLKERIRQSLELFWEYARREIINIETGQCFDGVNYGGGGREYNSPNYAWMCMEVYKVTGNTECVDTMMQILRYMRDNYGRRTAYIINMNMLENLEFLYELGRYDDYLELHEYYTQCGDWIVEDLPNYPSLEVKYEQSIVTPTVENIAAVYYMTGNEKYLEAIGTHYERMMALEGNQPSYFQNRIGIRHWDDYWFGTDDNTCGDTLHYWSALDARALKMYDMCMGTDHSREIRNIYMNNLANIAEDGRGFCAYLIARQNNNIQGERYNKLANDQDYALAIALKNYVMPQKDFDKKYVVRFMPNNVWLRDQETTEILKAEEGAEGASINAFPQFDLEDNHVLSWNTEKDGSGTTVTTDSVIQEDLVLYAQWEHPTGDIAGDVQVEGKLAETSGIVDLAEEGSSDWVQFCTGDLTNCARKDIENSLITNIRSIQGTSAVATDGAFSYTNSDAADTAPKNGYAIVAKGLDNGFTFELPSSDKKQRLRVYTGVWAGDVTFELQVNGIVQYQGVFGKPDDSPGAISQCFEVEYTIPESVNTITGKVYCTRDLDKQWGGCSVLLQAVTLGDVKEQTGTEELEEAIRQAEEAKEKAEEAQKKAETAQKEAEEARKQAEEARKGAEEEQKKAEAAQKEAETAREAAALAEEAAKEAEKQAEEARKKAEAAELQAGKDSEAARIAREEAERAKAGAEAAREEAEAAKAEAEAVLEQAKTAEASAKAWAGKAEASAAQAEELLKKSEKKAQEAEALLKRSEEKAREAEELLKKSGEKAQEAEEARKKAQEERIAAQEALKAAREAQKKAEEARAEAEQIRKELEESRKEAEKEAVRKKRTSLKSVRSPGKRQVKVRWKKASGMDGYELQYAPNAKFKKKSTITRKVKKNQTSLTIKKLRSKKTYYVRIRSYKNLDGENVYGAYSKVKKVKVK